jgi:hypothetical protein
MVEMIATLNFEVHENYSKFLVSDTFRRTKLVLVSSTRAPCTLTPLHMT